MKNENSDNQAQPVQRPKRRTVKIITWILAIAAGLFLLLFFGIPLFLSSSGGTNLLVGKINESVNGQVKMGDFSMGWFRGLKLTDLSYSDDTGDTSVTVRQIETHPQYTALLGGKVKLGKTIIDQPQIYLKVAAKQPEQPAQTEKEPSEKKKESQTGGLPINQMDLQVMDGSATIELADGGTQKLQFANITSNVQIAEAGQLSSVDLSMNVNDADVSAKGTVTTAKKGWMPEDGDFNVQVSKLQLGSLKPLFALAGQPMDMSGELNADATVQIKDGAIGRLKADATITDFAQGSGDQRTTFEKPVTLSALLVGSGNTVTIENASVQSAFCTLNCSGSLESLNYRVDADLAQTQRFAGQFVDMQGMAAKGHLAAQGKVDRTDDRIAVTGSGTAQQLVIQKDSTETPTTDVQFEFDGALDQSVDQFKLASANLTAAPGTVTISNLVLPLSAEAAKTVSMDAKTQLDLSKTWPFVRVFADVPKDLSIAGMLNSTVKVTTEQSQMQLVTDNTQIIGLKITQPDSEPFVQDEVSLNADVVLDMERQRYDIRLLELENAAEEPLIKINKGSMQKTSLQDTTKLSGQLEVQYDLKTLSAIASPFLPEGLMLTGKRTDALQFVSQYPTNQPDLMEANLNANATFGFEKAEFNGLNIGATEMKLNVVKGVMDFTIPQTTVNEGTMQFTGTMNLAETPRFFHLKKPMSILQNVQVNDTLTRKLLMYTNPVFADAVRTSGVLSFSCETMAIPLTKDRLNQIAIDGTFGIQSLRLQAGDFLSQILKLISIKDTAVLTLHPTGFSVKNGFVSYQDMQLDIGSTPIHFGGKIGLDKSLAMTVTVPIKDRNYPLPLGGTLTKPKLDVGKLLELQGRDLLEEGLRSIFD